MRRRPRLHWLLATIAALAVGPHAQAAPAPQESHGTMPFSDEPDTLSAIPAIFPLFKDKFRLEGKTLPPPYGFMGLYNWMLSDWRFTSASVSLGNSPLVNLDAAQKATMQLQITTTGVKGDVWVLPMVDVMGGFGKADIDVDLGLRDIPVAFDPIGGNTTFADAIIPMSFDGTYYSIGTVVAAAYRRLYGAVDMSWVKTSLEGEASLDSDGFWTFTAAPKFGYNAGLSQIYIGARYISKNENFRGTVPLSNGNPLTFDVNVKTATWATNAGIRTIIRDHWEVLMESAFGKRYQLTIGAGYRW
jgi:hypothetical protein